MIPYKIVSVTPEPCKLFFLRTPILYGGEHDIQRTAGDPDFPYEARQRCTHEGKGGSERHDRDILMVEHHRHHRHHAEQKTDRTEELHPAY